MHSSHTISGCFRDGIKFGWNSQLCFVLILLWPALQMPTCAESAANGSYLLGFLSPTPGANIPANLAQKWRSAFEVAVEVMNSNRSYKLVPHIEESESEFLPAQDAAHKMLQQEGLIGAVGPACSDAAMGAAQSFDQDGPAALVSFAATSEVLSNRTYYPTFFRTVYSDRHQAMAVAASIKKLDIGISNATLLYTKDVYSTGLASEINVTVGGLRMILLEPGPYNMTVDREQLKNILNSVQSRNFIILAVQPTVAEEIWTGAFEMDKTSFPWWYFGTDGATAFDPVDSDPALVEALQAEIGLAPHGGDLSLNSRCSLFYDEWEDKAAQYPGLPAMGGNKSRSYIPYLFDAVASFYEALDGLQAAGLPFSRQNVFMAFNESGNEGKISFDGCTGIVEFDHETGARSIAAQPPVYDVVALTVHSWELKGHIENATFETLDPLDRPGSYPAPGQTYYGPNPNGKKKVSGGLIAGIVFLVIAIMVLITACFVYYAKKKRSPVFVRIT